MAFFSVSCSHGSVYTYNNSSCFTTGESYELDEECRIDVLRNGVVESKSFDIHLSDTFWFRSSGGWTQIKYGPTRTQILIGDYFDFDSQHYYNYYSPRGDGFDFCADPTPTTENFALIGGDNTAKGNVYLNGQPICHYDWDDEDANLVCMKLGFDYGEPKRNSYFGYTDDDNFIMTQVKCTGIESSIWLCRYNLDDVTLCGVNHAAGVECHYDNDVSEALTENIKILLGVIGLSLMFCFCVCYYSKYQFRGHTWFPNMRIPRNAHVQHVVRVGNVQMQDVHVQSRVPNPAPSILGSSPGPGFQTNYVEPGTPAPPSHAWSAPPPYYR